MKRLFLALVCVALVPTVAGAAPILLSGYSDGQFVFSDGCSAGKNCELLDGGRLFSWGAETSTLGAAGHFDFVNTEDGVRLAALTWTDSTRNVLGLDLPLTLNFDFGQLGKSTTSIVVRINANNGVGNGHDEITFGTDLSALTVPVGSDYLLSGFRFDALDGSFDGTSWLRKDGSSTLYLTADLHEAPVDASQVPEPASMMLLGGGLLGIAAFARRRRRR